MQRLTSVVLCAIFATACASEAPETPTAAATEPMLELRVYFEGLVAFAPETSTNEAGEWVAIFATAPEPRSEEEATGRVPHSPEVFFSTNTVVQGTQDGVPAIGIQDRMLSFEFDLADGTPGAEFKRAGKRGDHQQYGKVPLNSKQAESFFWTPSMSAVTASSDQGKLNGDWETLSMKDYVAGGVVLNDGELATAALATAKCKDPGGPLAVVEFAGQGAPTEQALAETLVLIIKKPITSLPQGPVVTLRARSLNDRDASEETLVIRDGDWGGVGSARISVLIRNFPIGKHLGNPCTSSQGRTDGRHFDAFRALAQSHGGPTIYPRVRFPQPGSQPTIRNEFLVTKWHGVKVEIPTFPPICPPAVFE